MISPTDFDVLIIGGSVAGSTTAIMLRELGFRVGVVEREAAFRDKVRGEGIHPWGMDEARKLGIDGLVRAAGGRSLPEWWTYRDGEVIDVRRWADDSLRGEVETSVSHPDLQTDLLAAAQRGGAEILRQATVARIDQTSDGFSVDIMRDGRSGTLRATVVIAADGQRSSTRSRFGITQHKDPVNHWFCGLMVEGLGLSTEAAHAGLLPGGRCFVLPLANGRARVYLAVQPDRVDLLQRDTSGGTLLDFVADVLPAQCIRAARLAGPQGIFPDTDTWAGTNPIPGLVLIGDAAGANDPSQGHGVSIVFRDARELGTQIQKTGLDPVGLSAVQGRMQGYRTTLREVGHWMSRLWLTDGAEADARRRTYLAARERDPDAGGFGQIFSRGPLELVATPEAEQRFFNGPA